MKNLAERIRNVRDEHAEEEVNNNLVKHEASKRDKGLMILGGIRAVDRVAKALDSEVMKAALLFQSQDLHEAFGYSRFAEFLDNSEFSPMSKHEFYKRKEIFETEGEKLFDVLNAMDIPLTTRKLLGKGNVSLDGDTVIIKDGEEETTIELSDRTRILETLTTLADRSTEQSKRLKQGKEDFDKLKQKLVELEEQPYADYLQSPVEKFNSMALGALSALADELENATLVECEMYAEGSLKLLASQYNRINEILCRKLAMDETDWAETMAQIKATKRELFSGADEDRVASLLDDDE